MSTCLVVAACHGESKGGRVPVDTAAVMPIAGAASESAAARPTTAPPESAIVSAAPVVIEPADSAAGFALYHGKGRCFTCHGGLGRGTAKLGPDLTDTTWLNGDSSVAGIRGVIATGVATPRQFSVAMPAYAGMLDDADLTRLAAYVYTLSHPSAVSHSPTPLDSTPPRADTGSRLGKAAGDTSHSALP
ncbi:MAG TPA: c-type cytochrome [Gemmatimonadaceae bacterium]|nr:c-type cytochrome [Gemmatimonadaceae bacterium]